jgi:hypothetical protein
MHYSMFQCISMCLNVFINIVIEFHHHTLIVTFLPCTPTYTFVFYSKTMTPFPTCYTTTFHFFHAHWSIPTFIQSIFTFHIYTSPHIPHSTFHVVIGCAEHRGAQVIFSTSNVIISQFVQLTLAKLFEHILLVV